ADGSQPAPDARRERAGGGPGARARQAVNPQTGVRHEDMSRRDMSSCLTPGTRRCRPWCRCLVPGTGSWAYRACPGTGPWANRPCPRARHLDATAGEIRTAPVQVPGTAAGRAVVAGRCRRGPVSGGLEAPRPDERRRVAARVRGAQLVLVERAEAEQ